jgi:hypothetical protein
VYFQRPQLTAGASMQHERDMNRARESPLNPVSAGMLLGLFAIAGEQLRSMGVDPQRASDFIKDVIKDLEAQYERKLRAQALRRRRQWRQADLPALSELLLDGHAKPATQRALRRLSSAKEPGPLAIPPLKNFEKAFQDGLDVLGRLGDPATSPNERRQLRIENMPKFPDLVEAAYRGELAAEKRRLRLRLDRTSPHNKASDLAKQRVAEAAGISSAKVHQLCQEVRDKCRRRQEEPKLLNERGLQLNHGFVAEPAMSAAELKAYLTGPVG